MEITERDKKLIAIARDYTSPGAFKAGNMVKYLICQNKGLMRKAFPDYVPPPRKVFKVPKKHELPEDANLRDAIDDLMVRYRGIPTKEGKIRKITVNSVLLDLAKLLKDY